MKKLKYALLILALLVPAGLFAQGSDNSGGGQMGGQMGGPRHMPTVDDQLNEMSKKLDLTDAQKPQVKAILQDQHDQMKQLRENSSGSRQDNMAKMREIHDASAAKIRALLTDEQKAKFDKMEEEHHNHMRHGGADQGAPPPPPQQ